MECSLASRFCGVSYSAATPLSITSTLSLSIIVFSLSHTHRKIVFFFSVLSAKNTGQIEAFGTHLCATVRQVACANSVRMVCWMTASVSTSTAAVA